MADRDALIAELDSAREAFHDALAAVDAELVTVPGVVGDWSVRDLVVHIAAWDVHGADALDLAAGGRGSEFDYSQDQTDAMNEAIHAEALATSPTEALRREEAAFARFRDAIAGLDEPLIGLELGNGDTVEEVIVYDGPRHYDEHTEHLRAWFGTDTDEDG